jgi:hypothetical protein
MQAMDDTTTGDPDALGLAHLSDVCRRFTDLKTFAERASAQVDDSQLFCSGSPPTSAV